MHLDGFIIKQFVTMHGHTDAKLISLLPCSIVPNTVPYSRTSEKISGQGFISFFLLKYNIKLKGKREVFLYGQLMQQTRQK
jgi:hypothetical protein